MRKPSVHVYAKSGYLYYRFTWQGITCSEFPGLPDTPKNRKLCEKKAQGMSAEMDEGKFDYAYWFPTGKKKHLFTGRPDNNITVKRFILEVYEPYVRAQDTQSHTVDGYMRDQFELRIFPALEDKKRGVPALGNMLLKDLRPEHLDRFVNQLKEATWHRHLPIGAQEVEKYPLGVRRQNMAKRRLKQALKLAYQRKYIDEDLSVWIKMQREELPEVDPLSTEEQSVFLRAVPQRWVGWFAVAFGTGMRPSEQAALEWDDIDYRRNLIYIRRQYVRGQLKILKTRHSKRDLTMLPPVKDALLRLRQDKGGLVFPNAAGGYVDLANIRNRVWYPTLKATGLRLRELYQARHSFASVMLEAGESPAWVKEMLGHTSLRMVFERYGKYIKNRTRQDGSAYMQALKGGE
jgi:integrase